MIKIDIQKLEQSGVKCDNPKCKHALEYHWHVIGDNYHIRQDTICAFISLSDGGTSWSRRTYEVYCTECIDEIYKLCKLKLNKALWPFH